MTSKPIPMCSEHHTEKQWRLTTFEYHEAGITIRVPNCYAWVCPVDGEASFTPDIVDELLLTIRELLLTAKRAQGRRSELTQYIVSVDRAPQEKITASASTEE
ncbi:MAG: hypothetical protein FJ147_22285 [Deltaproteobacteria bacterium]|nr:hypothetical protein [Deltaproteobacteria bacterium]